MMAKMASLLLVYLVCLPFVATTPLLQFWRLLCHGQLGVARIDPLVAFGMVADHAHAVHGGSNFGPRATPDDMLASPCTSCSILQDRSAYWAPALYFRDDNGTYSLVPQIGGMTVYYFNDNGAPGEPITAFPHRFSMIAGDTRKRNFTGPIPDPPTSFWTAADMTQASLAEKAIGFNCLHYDKLPNEGALEYHYLRNKTFLDGNCADGVRHELMFPSCWNGRDLTSPDSKSHVQYPDFVKVGTCPPGFPVRLPALFYETIFTTQVFQNLSGEFILSNGDPTGFGYHGDFIAGWNTSFLQQAINTCTNPSGLQEDCPLFDLQNDGNATLCNMTLPDVLENEDVHGPLSNLPGNVAIHSGPAYAPKPTGTPLSVYASSSADQPSFTSQLSISSIAGTCTNTTATATSSTPPAALSTSTMLDAFITYTSVSSQSEVNIIVVIEEVAVVEYVTSQVTVPATTRKRHVGGHRGRRGYF